MYQGYGYVKDADRLNALLDRYAEDPRYQELFIDLVCNAACSILCLRANYEFLPVLRTVCSWGFRSFQFNVRRADRRPSRTEHYTEMKCELLWMVMTCTRYVPTSSQSEGLPLNTNFAHEMNNDPWTWDKPVARVKRQNLTQVFPLLFSSLSFLCPCLVVCMCLLSGFFFFGALVFFASAQEVLSAWDFRCLGAPLLVSLAVCVITDTVISWQWLYYFSPPMWITRLPRYKRRSPFTEPTLYSGRWDSGTWNNDFSTADVLI